MSTEVDAIRRAWGIGIFQAEADSAACAIQKEMRREPQTPDAQ